MATYRTYLRTFDGKISEKTVTSDAAAAFEAFSSLVNRTDLDGEKLAAALTYQNRQLAFHRFDRSPGDADYWREKLDGIEWPAAGVSRRPNYNEHRAEKRSFQANLKPEESDLVQTIKDHRGVSTDRELLLLLCAEENQRRVTSKR